MSTTTTLRAAFVVTTAFVATVTAAGCFGGTVNPPEPCIDGDCSACPTAQPEADTDCAIVGLECDYGDATPCADEPAHRATCGEDNKWQVEFMGSTCNPPPPPPCPETLPVAGELCEVDADGFTPMGCSYTVTTPCGEQQVTPSCVAEQGQAPVWLVEVTSCQGDPSACNSYDHPNLCAADDACRWLQPGCGEEVTAFDEGCFAKIDCSDDCDAGMSCLTVLHGAACEDEAQLCLPSIEATNP